MPPPRIVPRSEHSISRRDIDHDALKVLYRLQQFNHVAYLVGGSVRDLLLGRRPKDFDIGTSAHPYQVKRLFRNCWVIGRRFRLAHVKFGTKTVEVATFRRQVPSIEAVPDGDVGPDGTDVATGALHLAPPERRVERWTITDAGLVPVDEIPEAAEGEAPAPRARRDRAADLLIHRDNTFGTPEEDAFRRDFTVNALFYDIATFSIIDYVGGLADLEARLIRSIGDPNERFREDPVRMLRALALGARLGFRLDEAVVEAIDVHRAEITRSAPARLLEEFYKILRNGHAEQTFRDLSSAGLLEHITPELQAGASDALWTSLARLDAYRNRFATVPEALTNPILLGTLLVPLGFSPRRPARDEDRPEPPLSLGMLTLPRREVEHLRQILTLERRLLDLDASPRAQRALAHRGAFQEALTWLEIEGGHGAAVRHWRALLHESAPAERGRAERPRRRRRRRRQGP
jgi:poly(A) polymerase